jgi:hypothetical protein
MDMKKTLILFCMIAMSSVAMAQYRDVKLPPETPRSRYHDSDLADKGFWTAGEFFGGSTLSSEFPCAQFLQLTWTAGYRFNQYIRIGAGLGAKVYVNNGPKLRAYDSNWTAPFFVNARGNFMAQEDRGFSPYWSMNVGYVVKDGFFMSPTLGIRYGAMRSDFLLGISYSLNRIDNWPTVDKFTHSLMLVLGYEY